MSENESNKERPQEVVLDSASEAHLISRIKEAMRGGAGSTSKSSTPSELTDEEITALTDVIDQHVDARVAERMVSSETKTGEQVAQAPVSQEERTKRIQETVAEASKHGRPGMSELLRVVFEAERAKKQKQ